MKKLTNGSENNLRNESPHNFLTNGTNTIYIDKEYNLRCDGEFLTLEIPLHWYHHSKQCENCRRFFIDMFVTKDNIEWYKKNKPFEKWFFNDGDDFYQLLTNDFRPITLDSHWSNHYSNTNGVITKCKLKIKKCEAPEGNKKYFEDNEFYEICALIRDNGK